MRAVTIGDDGVLRLEEHPDPVPKDRDLLVAVRAAGLNAADIAQVAGRYPAPPGVPPDIPGLELSGEVVAVGPSVERFAPGDRVMALVAGGAQAELALVDERCAIALPESVDWPLAGAVPEALCSAHDALFRRCRLALGERVLVTGAAGGVGCMAIGLAALAGCHVVASARNPAAHETLRSLGARVAALPEEATREGPFDVVLELVGAPSLQEILDAGVLAPDARIVVIGISAGHRMELDVRRLWVARAYLTGSTLRSRSLDEKGEVVSAAAKAAVAHLQAGRLRMPILATFPLSEAASAYERFAAGAKTGKIVLVNDS
jgi:NADPH2:quinone reductase